MRLTLELQTTYQMRVEERDREKRRAHDSTLASLLRELWQASGIRPGVTERNALREAMERSGGS